MPWHNKQKFLVHLYTRAAALQDPEYRAILYELTGCTSATHPSLTQWHFDQVMARVEGLLDYRIAEGVVPPPPPGRIRALRYWRTRCPTGGAINSRQSAKITELWDLLLPHLPEDSRTDGYLAAIASKACGYRVASRWDLKAWQAGLLIDALRDRLTHALKKETAA